MQYFEICQFEACKEFEESFGNLFGDKLIEEGTLLRLWLMSTPEIGAKLIQNSVSNIFHQQFRNENNKEAFKRGNFTDLISQQTLRRIKSDVKSLERFSNNDVIDIVETQKHLRSVLHDDQIPGYIQYIVQDPFIIHLFTKKKTD